MPRHLKDLLRDQQRCEALIKEEGGLYIDFSRQRMTQETVKVRHVPDYANASRFSADLAL
jgi:hypothetical protein